MTQKNSSIRFQLTCLVTACVVPVWLIAGMFLFNAYAAKLKQVNIEMLQTARAMNMAVDRELTCVQSALLALATSPSFRSQDFRDLHRQALEILNSYPGADIIVADRTGQQLVNSFRPFGSPLPKRATSRSVQSVFQNGQPVISNLFFGAVTRRPLIGIDVPVRIDGKIAYDLTMTFPSERVAAILSKERLPEGWYCSVLDRNGVIAARTRDAQRYVGKPASAAFRKVIAAADEGTVDAVNVAGVAALSTFSKSSRSGWVVTFGVPKALVMAQVYRWIGWAVGGATAISLIGIFFAMGIARRIARDIQSLVGPAESIGRGEPVASIGIKSVKETAELAQALVQASTLLRRQAKERDRAEAQLSLTIVELRQETGERLRAMEELRKKEQLLLQQSRQAALGEMIGNIAHQWRQPLNALGLLVQQPPLFFEFGEVTKEFLEDNSAKSMQLVQHMSRTIDDFRNFFKPDKEKLAFEVREEVAKTLTIMEGTLQRQRIAIKFEARDNPIIQGFPNEFSQVLLNILINARDVVAERGIAQPKIVIVISTENGRAVVTITDNAGGIPEEIIDKIFDPYFSTKGPQVGTGVGLFMSKTIIEKNMGGLLSVRNVEGGAEFRIEV